MELKFWGIRGSIAVPGKDTVIYGGNTPCIEVREGNNLVILDAGTGIRELGRCLASNGKINKDVQLLISHTHWDHLLGLPFFKPLFDNGYSVHIYLSCESEANIEEVIDALMHPYFFPVGKEVFSARVTYNSVDPDIPLHFGEVQVESFRVNHSKGTLAYKLKHKGKTVVYMTDNEIRYEDTLSGTIEYERLYEQNSGAIEFCRGCDYLIHDSMYTLENYSDKRGWGHSNNHALALFSRLAEVKNLVLFHYDPDYSDAVVDEMLKNTRSILDGSNINCIAAMEGLEIHI